MSTKQKQSDLIDIEVACATPARQEVISLVVEPDCTLIDAVKRSDIGKLFPEIEVESATKGIFGVLKDNHSSLQAGDRIEIYRPLITDPKEARRRRAIKRA